VEAFAYGNLTKSVTKTFLSIYYFIGSTNLKETFGFSEGSWGFFWVN